MKKGLVVGLIFGSVLLLVIGFSFSLISYNQNFPISAQAINEASCDIFNVSQDKIKEDANGITGNRFCLEMNQVCHNVYREFEYTTEDSAKDGDVGCEIANGPMNIKLLQVTCCDRGVQGEEKISEQIKCVFNNSEEMQHCYTSDYNFSTKEEGFQCDGDEGCFVDVSGYPGERIVWRSSCEDYAYTTMDGEMEIITFNCVPQTELDENETSNLPSSWDWRDVHGENWLTSVKNQGSFGSCSVFGPIGVQEARINLYFNQHIDVDLSEQYILDCGEVSINGDYVPEPPLGIFPFVDYYPECAEEVDCPECNLAFRSKFICPQSKYCAQEIHGIVDEECYLPYREGIDVTECTIKNICSDWENRLWKIGGAITFTTELSVMEEYSNCEDPLVLINNNEDLKRALIENGPLSAGYQAHAMVLIGYKKSDFKLMENCIEEKHICKETGCVSQCSEGEIFCRNSYDNGREGNQMEGFKFICNSSGGLEFFDGCSGNPCVNGECLYEGNISENQEICFIPDINHKSVQPRYLMEEFPNDLYTYSSNNGEDAWIFKNSWGVGNLEYLSYVSLTPSYLSLEYVGFNGEVISNNSNYQIICNDKDNDGSCNWGISNIGLNNSWRRQNCPDSCRNQKEKDCNDANASLNSFDENFNCIWNESSPWEKFIDWLKNLFGA